MPCIAAVPRHQGTLRKRRRHPVIQKKPIPDFPKKTISPTHHPTALQRSITIMAIEMIEEFNQGTQIKVIGVGGGGGNAVEHMIAHGVQGVQFVCANTDAQALNHSSADHIIQLGNTGLGAGAKPEVGRAAAEEAIDRIRQSIDGAHMLFITAGMGGGTGTGAAPVIARVAKEMGILTVGVVTKPFEFEGDRRTTLANEGLAELEANVDSLIVILNDRLLDVLGDDITQDQAFAHANDVLKNAVGGISDIIHMPGLVNVDFEDVKTVMSEPGKAMMGTAVASGPDRATKAAEAAVACSLLEGIDLSGARGVLVLIAANRSTFKLSESRNAMNTIRRFANAKAHVIYGTGYDETLGDQMRITVIVTGTDPKSAQGNRAQATMQIVHNVNMQRTGTDNMPFVPSHLHTPGRSGHDYSALSTPSVWRNGRTAAAKVDALASNGMDEIEIPAFLRKQAD